MMRRRNGILASLLCIALAGYSQNPTSEKEGFQLIKDKDNIRIYERWITFPKSSPAVTAREVKSVFYANTTVSNALSLLQDEKRIQKWQNHVSKFKVYNLTDTAWLEYSYHDIPWPVSDQDHMLRYRVEETIPGKRMFISFESIKNDTLAPVTGEADRMKLAGSWLYEQQKGKVKITYRILSMPSTIPRFFTDPVIRNNMMSTIKSYVEILEEQQGSK